ncbi:MAG: SUF system NifU family Fe-S cluster assembly protein [Gammaproteobacteria bacterium]|nr:SUF system NifU family Fe-S cluster assembly protein [Gammaproteobacteria bacterium]MDH4315519.1 SUF system NifU family Fe-S cluster assembly protein [Gammaproteobacteria bacterium]MDH5214304.1 SUF system NifU family Fe-S cluster assembly protein [Gammaproteobacteria bacterium]
MSTDELRELYRELILDHARSPRHFGKLPEVTHSADGLNPLCGDKLKLYLRIGDDDRIQDAAFEGSGCAISVASASLLTDTIIGMRPTEAQSFAGALIHRLTGKQTNVELGKLRALEGVREFPSRIKCATLAWHAMNSAIRQDKVPASTE